MRESRTYGSVRGALSNGRPYRDRVVCAALASGNAPGDPGALLRTVGSQPGWDFAHDTSRSRFGDHQVHRGKYGDLSGEERGDRKSKGIQKFRSAHFDIVPMI